MLIELSEHELGVIKIALADSAAANHKKGHTACRDCDQQVLAEIKKQEAEAKELKQLSIRRRSYSRRRISYGRPPAMTPKQLTRIKALAEHTAKNYTVADAIGQAASLNPWQIAEAIILWKALNKASKDGPDVAIQYLGGK